MNRFFFVSAMLIFSLESIFANSIFSEADLSLSGPELVEDLSLKVSYDYIANGTFRDLIAAASKDYYSNSANDDSLIRSITNGSNIFKKLIDTYGPELMALNLSEETNIKVMYEATQMVRFFALGSISALEATYTEQ